MRLYDEENLNKAFDIQTIGEGADFKTIILAIITELTEALEETDWKWWKDKPFNREKLEYELADVFIFFTLLCKYFNISSEQLAQIVHSKTKINSVRADHKNYKPKLED